MAFQLDIGGAETKISNPNEILIRECIENIWADDRDSFLILRDTDNNSFVQCAADYEETDFFYVEYSSADQNHYRCDGLVCAEEVTKIFTDYLGGKDPEIDDEWLDVTEEIFGPDMSDWD